MKNRFYRLKVLGEILRSTGADKILASFVGFVFMTALVIMIFDPAVTSYGDALWYCYAVISTAGFGDVIATSPVSRCCSVLLTAYSVLVVAIVTGVVVNYYTQLVNRKDR